MTTTLTWLCVLGVVFLTTALFAWFWHMVLVPLICRLIAFRIENNLDSLKLRGLSGEVQGQLYYKMKQFLEDALEAPKAHRIFIKLPKSNIQGKKIRIQELRQELSEAPAECRELVDSTLHFLSTLYLAQRPMIVGMLLPIALLATFMQRYRRKKDEKEVEFAASTLAAAFALAQSPICVQRHCRPSANGQSVSKYLVSEF